MKTVKDGRWDDPTVWDENRVPAGWEHVLVAHCISWDPANEDVDGADMPVTIDVTPEAP